DITRPGCHFLASLQVSNVEIGQQTAAVWERPRLKLDDPSIAQPHFRSGSRTLAHRLDTPLDILLELIRWDVIEVFTPDMSHEIAHPRAGLADEFIRDVPHFAECAVDQLGAKIGSHEQDAVVDRVENGMKFLIRLRKCGAAARHGRPPTVRWPSCRSMPIVAPLTPSQATR